MTFDRAGVIYHQIADRLERQIAEGRTDIPSERELAAETGHAIMTARGAMLELERRGVLERGTRGRRIARREILTVHVTRTADLVWGDEGETLGADAWTGDVHRAGGVPTQDIEVVIGHGVITRRLLRKVDGQPHNQITFTFPSDIAQGTLLAAPGSITEGSISWLDKTHGPLTHELYARPRMPTAAEQELFRIPALVPVQLVLRVARTRDRELMTSEAVYPSDRCRLKLIQ